MADLNGDGRQDIVSGNSSGVQVVLNAGGDTLRAPLALVQSGGLENGTFGAPVFYPVDRVPIAIVAGDFDRDGATHIALLTAHEGTDRYTTEPIGGYLDIFYNQGGDHVSLASSSATPKANQAVTLTAT